MYSTKIPGTKYEVAIERDGGIWYIRVKLYGNVESEEVLPQITQTILEKKLMNVLKEVNVHLNDLQFKMLFTTLTNQLPHLVKDDTPDAVLPSPEQLKKIDELEKTVKSLEKTIETLLSRIERLEEHLA